VSVEAKSVVDHKCAHAKIEVTYVLMNWLNIWEHVQGGGD